MADTDIQGVVVDEDGNPVSGATVELFLQTGAAVTRTTTDANGEYIFTEHPDGDGTSREWHVVARYSDGSGDFNTLARPHVTASLPQSADDPFEYNSTVDVNDGQETQTFTQEADAEYDVAVSSPTEDATLSRTESPSSFAGQASLGIDFSAPSGTPLTASWTFDVTHTDAWGSGNDDYITITVGGETVFHRSADDGDPDPEGEGTFDGSHSWTGTGGEMIVDVGQGTDFNWSSVTVTVTLGGDVTVDGISQTGG